MNNPPKPERPPHSAFITARLPSWLTSAPHAMRNALRNSVIKSNQSRHDLKALLQQIKNPADFAYPLLENALKREFRGLVNEKNTLLVREWKHHHLLGLIKTHAQTTEHSLLEAALQNFEADEAEDGGMESGSGLYTTKLGQRALNPIGPTRFAELCRDLDIGRSYQAHLDEVLGPTYSLRMTSRVQKCFVEQEKNAMAVALHLARLNNTLTQPLYDKLLVLAQDGKHPDLTCNHLTINAVILPSVLVIQSRTNNKELILYTPQDPLAPLRHHSSLDDLESKLAERLDTSPGYIEFFKRLVPLQHRETLLKIKPAWVDWQSVGTTFKMFPISLEATVTCTLIEVHAFLAVTRHRINQIKMEARLLAVPTADTDLISRQKRLQSYIDVGKSLLFFAASFVPIVGEVLLAVCAAQLLDTVYNGFAAWSRGDSDEALNDLFDVVDNVALAAATAGAIKTVGFTAGLVRVKLQQGGERLWNPDRAPYRHLKKQLPAGLPANAQGLYHHEQQHFLKLDDHLHTVKQAPHNQEWQLQHPNDPHSYTPPLHSNGVGSWRLAHETSRDWDDLKLIKRLGPDATNIGEHQIEPLLLVSGVDSTTLRQVHEDVLRPPPLLRTTLKRFNLDQEINDFDTARAEGAVVTPLTPYMQLHLTCSLPEWSANRILRIVDEQGVTVVSHGTGNAETQVSLARFRKGELLHCLENQLHTQEFNQLLPASAASHLTKVESLSQRLVENARQHRPRLFAWLSLTLDKPTTTVEQQIAQIVPELSKSHLEEMASTLSTEQRRRLHREKSLTAEQNWEAEQYVQQARASQALQSLHLASVSTDDTPVMLLATLERMPGWPTAHRIEVRDQNSIGRLLGCTGPDNATLRYTVTREGPQFRLRDAQGKPLHESTDLFSAISQTLSASQLATVLRPSGATSLRQAVSATSLKLMARKLSTKRATLSRSASFPATNSLDPLFAEPSPPENLSLRADGIYQTPALPDGSYRYYALDNTRYYRVEAGDQGWRLIDARSPFRAYQPYIRKKPAGGWQLDAPPFEHPDAKGAPDVRGDAKQESVEPDKAVPSADENSVLYTPAELLHMRSSKSYKHSQNYLGVYDRANNGRYPLRDEEGQPLRIRFMESFALARRTGTRFNKALVLPYIKWEGFEKVAALYDTKLKVTPFTAAHQKFAQESSLIGQNTVVTTRAIRKGEALGVYGGELLPLHIAGYRHDPYLIDVSAPPISANVHPGVVPQPKPLRSDLVLSGDNVLSRINTLLDYENGKPVRQARTGYNVINADFNVDAQVGDQPMVRLQLSALFADEDLAPGTELRWNYGYDEDSIRRLFDQPD